MYQPKPYGLSVRGGAPTDNDLRFVDSMVRHITNHLDISPNVESLKRQYDLPDGGYVVVQFMGGVLRANIVKGDALRSEKPIGYAESNIPTFYSGAITRSVVDYNSKEYVSVKLTRQCAKRLSGYGEVNVPGELSLDRLSIEYAEKFKYFEPKIKGVMMFSQYTRLRPTWYSGSMKKLIQVISGYGKQQLDSLPDSKYERATVTVPPEYFKGIEEELQDKRLPAYTGFPDPAGAINYDYAHAVTDGVAFGQDGAPWLVNISPRGVYAMPLPIIPATTTKAYRLYAESVADIEVLEVLNTFGGFPSGEMFPEKLDQWIKAGVVIKVCDSADFYSHSAFYPACGWSFNTKGNEVFNTCWDTQAGLKHAHGYKGSFSFGPLSIDLNVGGIHLGNDDDAKIVSDYLNRLTDNLDLNSDEGRAVMYKVRRSGAGLIVERSKVADKDDTAFWLNLELTPVANVSGHIKRVTTGPMYNPAHQVHQAPWLKFPVITGEGCESFDMTSRDYKGDAVMCDTVVFGCYVEDELRTIKYFYDGRKFTKTEQSDYERYMYVGSWEKRTVSGNSGIDGHFYTTDFDDRADLDPDVSSERIRGTDLGWGNTAYGVPPLLYKWSSAGRSRYYKRVTVESRVQTSAMNVAACVPVYARDCILFPNLKTTPYLYRREYHTRGGVTDPTSYGVWTADRAFHYIGQNGKGEPRPTLTDYIYLSNMNYEPTPANEFADGGNWLNLPPNGYIDVTAIIAPYTIRHGGAGHANGATVGGEAPQVAPYDVSETKRNLTSGYLGISLDPSGQAKVVHKKNPEPWYFTMSPVESGGSLVYFYRDINAVTIGTTKYCTFSELVAPKARYKWGNTNLVDDGQAYNFIGVICE